MIRLIERAAPWFRNYRAGQGGEQGLRIRVGERKCGDFREYFHVAQGQSLCVFRRAHAWSERIARIERHIHHAAPLHAVFRAPRAVRKSVSVEVAIVARIGINEASHRAVFRCNLGFDPTPARPVAGNHNGVFYGDSKTIQLFVV